MVYALTSLRRKGGPSFLCPNSADGRCSQMLTPLTILRHTFHVGRFAALTFVSILTWRLAATSQFLHEITRPHPFRQKAGDKMVYGVPLLIFEDDVSGNVSKQWNKHFVVYMSNGNIPREMIDKEYCVRFVTSSPHASPMELMQGVKDNIE